MPEFKKDEIYKTIHFYQLRMCYLQIIKQKTMAFRNDKAHVYSEKKSKLGVPE